MVDGESLHTVYMGEAGLKLNRGGTQLGNSARAEISVRPEIIENLCINRKTFSSDYMLKSGLCMLEYLEPTVSIVFNRII